MSCSSSTAEPCIHTENCHHYRPDDAARGPRRAFLSLEIDEHGKLKLIHFGEVRSLLHALKEVFARDGKI
ncbi:hypothetical protein [Chromobacterium subtsugae]|uniref:hypothetical protein n=1 Tax=Chromobacterium subtsugae TaxID=251747 RepID=UPI0012FF976B|nr:hypothetical protein [Chromobacterium subtsugae]